MNQKLVEEEKHATERSLLSSDKQEQYVRFLSRRGANDTYTFTSVEIMPAIFSLTPPEIPEKACFFIFPSSHTNSLLLLFIV